MFIGLIDQQNYEFARTKGSKDKKKRKRRRKKGSSLIKKAGAAGLTGAGAFTLGHLAGSNFDESRLGRGLRKAQRTQERIIDRNIRSASGSNFVGLTGDQAVARGKRLRNSANKALSKVGKKIRNLKRGRQLVVAGGAILGGLSGLGQAKSLGLLPEKNKKKKKRK